LEERVSAGFRAGSFKGKTLEAKELSRAREIVGFMVGLVLVRIKLGIMFVQLEKWR
jgi:hypothetical protein